jgi:hypothetical protein
MEGNFEINSQDLYEILELEKDSEQSNKNLEDESKKKLIFKNLNFYVEIFNKTIDQSDLLDEIITSNGGNVKNQIITYLNL